MTVQRPTQTFTRALITAIVPAVETAGWRVMCDASTFHFHGDHWEFNGPTGFYWHGSASDAYEARYKGWMAYLRQNHKDLWKKIEDGEL